MPHSRFRTLLHQPTLHFAKTDTRRGASTQLSSRRAARFGAAATQALATDRGRIRGTRLNLRGRLRKTPRSGSRSPRRTFTPARSASFSTNSALGAAACVEVAATRHWVRWCAPNRAASLPTTTSDGVDPRGCRRLRTGLFGSLREDAGPNLAGPNARMGSLHRKVNLVLNSVQGKPTPRRCDSGPGRPCLGLLAGNASGRSW